MEKLPLALAEIHFPHSNGTCVVYRQWFEQVEENNAAVDQLLNKQKGSEPPLGKGCFGHGSLGHGKRD